MNEALNNIMNDSSRNPSSVTFRDAVGNDTTRQVCIFLHASPGIFVWKIPLKLSNGVLSIV